jgi:hypothetical protein
MNTCQMFRGPSLCMPIAVLLDATVSAEHLLQHSVLNLYGVAGLYCTSC